MQSIHKPNYGLASTNSPDYSRHSLDFKLQSERDYGYKACNPDAGVEQVSDLRRRVRRASRAFNAGDDGPRVAIGTFGPYTMQYLPATSDEDVLDESFDRDIFFLRIPDFAPKTDGVILDVGAYIGTFSMLAATKVPNGRVFAIEASQETFNFLKINVALNKAQNILPIYLALSDRAGIATLHHDRGGNWGHSITKTLSSHSEQVTTDSLHNFCKEHMIARIALMKFNCEGAEFPILLGSFQCMICRILT